MNLSSDFFSKTFLIQYFDSRCKDSKVNRDYILLSSEMYGLSLRQGLTLSPMENIWCSFKYFEQCSYMYDCPFMKYINM